jgi:hypothetical protein
MCCFRCWYFMNMVWNLRIPRSRKFVDQLINVSSPKDLVLLVGLFVSFGFLSGIVSRCLAPSASALLCLLSIQSCDSLLLIKCFLLSRSTFSKCLGRRADIQRLCKDKQSPEGGNITSCCNVACIKYTSDCVQRNSCILNQALSESFGESLRCRHLVPV